MPLTIDQVHGQIGIDRIAGKLEMQNQFAKLELKHNEAKINMHTELPKIQIDQYEAFASAGLKGPIDLTREFAQRGYQQVMEYIGNTAQDGYRLAAIENGGNPIKEIAIRRAYPEHEFGLDYIPKVGPKISLKEGYINIEPEPNGEGVHNGIEANYTPGHVQYNFMPTEINIYMKQYPSISINYQPGNNIDVSI